jgi:hypothetical protein
MLATLHRLSAPPKEPQAHRRLDEVEARHRLQALLLRDVLTGGRVDAGNRDQPFDER